MQFTAAPDSLPEEALRGAPVAMRVHEIDRPAVPFKAS
jgi:hypothetical protein